MVLRIRQKRFGKTQTRSQSLLCTNLPTDAH